MTDLPAEGVTGSLVADHGIPVVDLGSQVAPNILPEEVPRLGCLVDRHFEPVHAGAHLQHQLDQITMAS